ncbi:MAG: WYL domain-containing protein [Verrucomicrobiota bacterium]
MKAVTRPQYHRIRRMLELIREGTRSGQLPNRGDFCRELEISARTAARDLDFLRDELRAPVAYEAAGNGYRLTALTFALPPVQLTRQEVFSFSVARKLLERFEGTPLELDMRSVLGKIAESLEGTISLDVEGVTEQFTVLSEDHARVDSAVWQQAARAINHQERLQMEYRRFDGVTGSYTLEPYHLVAYHGNWYLVARNAAANKLETFALSRCLALRGAGEYFVRPKDFDAKVFLKTGFGITQAEQPWQVRLLFSRQVATYIRERQWHASQRMIERRDGRLELRLETSGRKELTRWILSWMPEVKVLAPRELKARVKARLKAGIKRQG